MDAGRQGFCAKISDNAPLERLPKQYAYISFGSSELCLGPYKRPLRKILGSFVAGLSSERRARVLLALSRTFGVNLRKCIIRKLNFTLAEV